MTRKNDNEKELFKLNALSDKLNALSEKKELFEEALKSGCISYTWALKNILGLTEEEIRVKLSEEKNKN